MQISLVNNRTQYINKPPVFKGVVEDFGSKAKEVFAKTTIQQNDKQVLTEMLQNAFEELIKPERFLGKGFNGAVYKIDKDFVAKIRKSSVITHKFLYGGFQLGSNIFQKLKTYYGEALCAIGQVQILKNAGQHTPAGIPFAQSKLYSHDQAEYYYNKVYLPLFAKVAQKSYDNIAMDMARMNKMNASNGYFYAFDSRNPGNIVLSGDKLLLMDEIELAFQSETNSVGKLLELLLARMALFRVPESYGNGRDAAKEIFYKIILASEKANLPYDSRSVDIRFWEIVLANLGIKTNADEIIHKLEVIRGRNFCLEKRLPKVVAYLNNVFEQNKSSK